MMMDMSKKTTALANFNKVIRYRIIKKTLILPSLMVGTFPASMKTTTIYLPIMMYFKLWIYPQIFTASSKMPC